MRRKNRDATLTRFVQTYATEHDIAAGTVQQLEFAVKALDRWHKRQTALDDLTDDLLNRWISDRLEAGISRATVRNQRGAILTLWRAAYEAGILPAAPARVKKVRGPATLPQAWEASQVQQLLFAVNLIDGTFSCGVPRKALIRALVLTGWYSGLRPCDLLSLKREQIGSNGTLIIVQKKTGAPIMTRLPEDCMAAIEATFPPERDRIFPISNKVLFYWWKQLQSLSGIRGSPKWLRRSGATAVESEHPGSAMGFLGHRTPGLAWKHYIDARMIQLCKPMPPRIA